MLMMPFSVVTFVLAGLSAVVAVAGLLAAAGGRPGDAPRLERREILFQILVLNLLVMRLCSWPSVLFLARSLVPSVPGAMCAFGVMNATPHWSLALAGAKVVSLMGLVTAQLFLRAQRRAPPGSLYRASAAMVAVACLLGLIDAGVDAGFLLADRHVDEVSCCLTLRDLGATAKVDTQNLGGVGLPALPSGIVSAVIAVFALMAYRAAARATSTGGSTGRALLLWLAAALGIVTFLAGMLASIDVLSPIILHRPHHHCPVEVWTETIDGLFMLILLFLGSILPSGALALSFAAREGGARPAVAHAVEEALRFASFALLGSIVMFLCHVVVARLVA
jgi:hypothetical protein